MNTDATTPPPPNVPGTADTPQPLGPPRTLGQPIDSQALLQGQRELLIHHQGTLYRLQATRMGKLILTK